MNAPTRPPGSAVPEAKPSARFVWEDPFLLEDQLSEDERAIRDTAQTDAQERLLPGIVEAYAKETTDRSLFRRISAVGLLDVSLRQACARRAMASG